MKPQISILPYHFLLLFYNFYLFTFLNLNKMENTLETSKQIEISLFSNTKITNERIGIVYRKLRKFKEMNKDYENCENQESHYYRDKNLSSKRKKIENKFLLTEKSEEKLINLAVDKQETNQGSINPHDNVNSKGKNCELNDKKKELVNAEPEFKVVEYDKAKKILEYINNFEEEFNEKWKNSIKMKINSYNQNKKNKNVFPKFKFNKKDILIDQISYPLENILINFEVLIINIVMIFHKNNEKLFNTDTKNIGSYIQFYICTV